MLAELVSYIEEFNDGKTVFKLAELVTMYSSRLRELDGNSTKVNGTRLKEKLIKAIPELVASKASYGVVLSYNVNIGDVLLSVCKQNSDDDAMIIMRSAQIVRKEILQLEYKFSNSLTDDTYDQFPRSLTALNEMISRGTSVDLDQPREVSCAARSIMIFNSVKRERKENKSGSIRHSSVRETHLPLYMGLLIHAKTRKRELVDILYEHGLSVSYDRVMQLSTDIANQVIAQYQEDGVVCPPKLKRGLFVTGQLDNVDHNLFSMLYISCQNREGDVDTLSSHENHAWPPSLAENGEMRGAESKSDILKQLEPIADAQLRSPDDVQVKIVDGAALVQGLEPKSSSQRSITFSDFAQNVFVPNILRKMNTCDRCDVVWDIYREDSLKAHTRATR